MGSYVEELYNDIIYEKMDPRVKGWFFMDSPLYITVLVGSYLLFVKKIGPWWMEGRPRYDVDKAMLLYNIVQMTINAHFFYTGIIHIWLPGHYKWACQKPIIGPNPTEDFVVSKFYLFMWSRILDLLDTVFMVLKKNNHQISFLHLYHHVLVATCGWIFVKYQPGGHVAFFGTVNSFVHVVMYFYYFLTAYDASYKKSIWWKKHITELQLVQFAILIFQQIYSILTPSCEYPKLLLYVFTLQGFMMFYLFGKFYINAYTKRPNKKE